MDSNQFNTQLEHRINLIREVLFAKKAEYASRSDRMHNFKRAAAVLNTIPEAALIGMMAKHIVSVLDIVDNIPSGTVPSIAMIEEKCGDSINYLILLEAMLKERAAIMAEGKTNDQP